METKASQFARQVMEKNTKDAITKMSSTLSTRANKFHGKLKFKLNVINRVKEKIKECNEAYNKNKAKKTRENNIDYFKRRN
jgi:hypothetical protein